MLLKPLYRVRFRYPHGWSVDLTGPEGKESQLFFLAEGRCAGRVAGVYRGANHPRRRTDGTYLPDFQGVIETDDGAIVFFDWHGYGRAYPKGRRQIVAIGTHVSEDERYRWLNDVVCVGTGEVRADQGAGVGQSVGQGGPSRSELVLDVAELVWEPIPE